MITSIHLKNFKCFEDEKIPIAPLTVLSGVNGMGKSTTIQSLLMLRQSLISGTEGGLLNGPLITLGSAEDVLYENADNDSLIGVAIDYEPGANDSFEFTYSKGNRILQRTEHSANSCSALLIDDFFYLQAERIGPRNSFPCSDYENQRYNRIGNSGEFCADLLSKNERKLVESKAIYHKSQPIGELLLQVEAWMSEIGQYPRIHLNNYSRMDATSMEFSFMRNGIPSNNYRASNVGFGLTYSLPIFFLCLYCKPGGLILIENPEAHLHPKGQVAIGKFLAKKAATGAQIIVETHSDHVLNGIRIAVKNREIVKTDVALHFFARENNAPNTTYVSPVIDQDGRLNQWPDGFFDSWENGLAELL